MQTFLPFSSYELSAKCLDRQRLGKQRVECKQILDALKGKSKGWVNHPATKMWVGYKDSLKLYMIAILEEWEARGYNNNIPYPMVSGDTQHPHWMGWEEFHISHRANLLRKNYGHYYHSFKEAGVEIPKNYQMYSYIWPSGKN